MSHISHCPEFQLARSDSKNPATTCRGLTSEGRKCRRTVVSSTSLKKASKQQGSSGGIQPIAVQVPGDLFCWQHQNQNLAPSQSKAAGASRLHARSSMDTLIERVGVLSVDEVRPVHPRAIVHSRSRPPRADREAKVMENATLNVTVASKSKPRQRVRFACFFMPIDHEEEQRVARVKQSHRRSHSTQVSRPPSNIGRRPATSDGKEVSQHTREKSLKGQSSIAPLPLQVDKPQLRPSIPTQRGLSQTEILLSWIPSALSPETTSKLLQKLAEPLSAAEEAGYIYVYCVTPTDSVPQVEETASLIPPPVGKRDISRRTSDVMSSAGIAPTSRIKREDPGGSHMATTITLKIGRAVNVSRRLTQQCSQNLTLVRYYPYYSASEANPSVLPQKAPNIHRLERLVHLELADIRVKPGKSCQECGKKHQEYFEIEANKEQLRRVDECVKRWIKYSQLNPAN